MIVWWPVGLTGEEDAHGKIQRYEARIGEHTVQKARRPGTFASRYTVGTAEYASFPEVLEALRSE